MRGIDSSLQLVTTLERLQRRLHGLACTTDPRLRTISQRRLHCGGGGGGGGNTAVDIYHASQQVVGQTALRHQEKVMVVEVQVRQQSLILPPNQASSQG